MAAGREVDKLKELRAALENASQSYWATQVEVQMLAASAWIAQAKGETEMALKFMRAAADLEDGSAKHIAMENRLYPMRGCWVTCCSNSNSQDQRSRNTRPRCCRRPTGCGACTARPRRRRRQISPKRPRPISENLLR